MEMSHHKNLGQKRETSRVHRNSLRNWKVNKEACRRENESARKKAERRHKKNKEELGMKKKGQAAAIIIGGIFLILVVGAVIVMVIVGSQKGIFSGGTDEDEFGKIEIFLKEKNNVESNYIITTTQGVLLSEGILSDDAYTPIRISNNDSIDIYCWGKDRYVGVVSKSFTAQDRRLNKTKIDCVSTPIGKLEVKVEKGDISRSENRIVFNVTAREGEYHGLGMCFAWSAGIIEVENQNDFVECPNGLWKNYSFYNVQKKKYDYLPEGFYQCGKDRIEQCKETSGNKCFAEQLSIPFRHSLKVDECSYIGEDLKEDESYTIRLNVVTLENKNALDYLKVIFFDTDLRYIYHEETWYDAAEDIAGDIGSDDVVYKINYEENEYEYN